MSPFHVNYQNRLAEVTAALDTARREERIVDVQALELAMSVLDQHLGELRRTCQLALA
jgi:hypothetical protein